MTVATQDVVAKARSGRPDFMRWITPYLTVKDIEASLDFYEAAFGFERQEVNPNPDGTITHARMIWQDGSIMMGPEGAYGGTSKAAATSGVESPVSLYVYCDDVDALAERAAAAGATVKFAPMDTFWGDRCCMLVDLDGLSWNFATHKGMPTDSPQD